MHISSVTALCLFHHARISQQACRLVLIYSYCLMPQGDSFNECI